MRIKWDVEPSTIEQKIALDYLKKSFGLVERFAELIASEGLLTCCFTPIAFEKDFFTYEIRKENSSGCYLAIVWKGIRTGDALPMLYGRVENQK